ncbi:MAG: penicillin-insensitive murein endopeptidase [Rhodobacteraceae bacterium]|nr:penicillin-insensitive murein endopeptidase [Paracoccaceae bacterium]
MIRTLTALASALALTACLGGSVPPAAPLASQAAAAVFISTAGDDRAAKPLFGHISIPSDQASEPLGFYSRGCQAGAVQLAETGPTWQAMRLSRNRNWAQPATVDFVQNLSRFAARQPGWAGLYVGDMSQPRGGPMLTGHASHQTGLDLDIWMLPPARLDLTRDERENLSSIRTDRHSGAYVNDAWTPQHMAILREAARDPRVARIFVFAGAKVEMCNTATGDRAWLNKIRPWYGHNYHFHVRLNCVPGTQNCEDQAPPPPGDGCADAQEWVDNILNPPPPNPNPRPPRGPVIMSQLPGQCQSVLISD